MAFHSGILMIALVFAVLFTVLYASGLDTPRHPNNIIPTDPKVSQLQAIEIVEQDLKEEVPNLESAHLYFYLYNYSQTRFEEDVGYSNYVSRNLWNGREFSTVKKNPQFLQLPLIFVHLNGTTYSVNSTSHSYEKLCDQPSADCAYGRIGSYPSVRDRLVYRTESTWSPGAKVKGHSISEGYHIVDAETGEVVWNSIDSVRERRPLPNIDFEGQKTVKMRIEERLNPPKIIEVQIANGSSTATEQAGFVPQYAYATITIDNKIVWTNHDSVQHTVRSDSDYTNSYTGEFRSELISPNGTYEYTFMDVGEYPYHCDIHPWMQGGIEIREGFA